MPRATLLEKAYGPFSPETLEPVFLTLCKALKVKLRVVGKTSRGWVKIEVSGEDEVAALHFLDREAGLAPVSAKNIGKFSAVEGRVVFSGKEESGLYVDIGVYCPEIKDAFIPLQKLQNQLVDGKNLPIRRLVQMFCLHNNLPLGIKIVQEVDAKKGWIAAELSEAQLAQIVSWVRFNFDRLIVLGAFFTDVERALKASKHFRDVIRIESLGTLEQVILCKLGTDAVGLISNLGRFLPHAILVPFSPRRNQQLVGNRFFDQ